MRLLAPCLVIFLAMLVIVISFFRIQLFGFDWMIGGEIVCCAWLASVNVERIWDWRRQ